MGSKKDGRDTPKNSLIIHLGRNRGAATYWDEILHATRLSPLKRTQQLSEHEASQLFVAARETLIEWIDRLQSQSAGALPERVTAVRPETAVHGNFKQEVPSMSGTGSTRSLRRKRMQLLSKLPNRWAHPI